MQKLDNDIPKYIKKKESSTSKSKVKSKHKHEYVDCLFVNKGKQPHKGTYCKICGKIGNMAFFESEKTENGFYRILDYDEVFEKYKYLEKKYIEDVFQKYVGLDTESECE